MFYFGICVIINNTNGLAFQIRVVIIMLEKIKAVDDNLINSVSKLHNPVLNKIMLAMTFMGDQGKVWFLVLAIILYFKRSLYIGVSFFSALAVSWLFAEIIIKRIVARVRPCHKLDEENLILRKMPKFYSFPSSHSATSFAMCTVSFFLCGTWVTVFMFLIALGISFSWFYLQAHYMTDVVCGILLGIIIAILAVKITAMIMSPIVPVIK